MSRQLPNVSIIIPIIGYNFLPRILISNIKRLSYPKNKLELIIINNSKVNIPKIGIKVTVIIKNGSIGYSQAVNLGVKKSSADFLFLINPDVKLDRECLLIFLKNYNNETGVLGPKVYSLSTPQSVSNHDLPGVGFNPTFARIKPISVSFIDSIKTPYEVNWVSGCAMFFSKKVWRKIGGFDERLFIYWEDADFCMKAKRAGYKITILPSVKVWHAGSAYMESISLTKVYYIVRNGKIFYRRYSNLFGIITLHALNLLVVIVKSLKWVMKQDPGQKAFIFGIIDFYLGRNGESSHNFT